MAHCPPRASEGKSAGSGASGGARAGGGVRAGGEGGVDGVDGEGGVDGGVGSVGGRSLASATSTANATASRTASQLSAASVRAARPSFPVSSNVDSAPSAPRIATTSSGMPVSESATPRDAKRVASSAADPQVLAVANRSLTGPEARAAPVARKTQSSPANPNDVGRKRPIRPYAIHETVRFRPSKFVQTAGAESKRF